MQVVQKFQILRQRKQQLLHCIDQNYQYSQYLDTCQNMRYLFSSTQIQLQQFRKILKDRTQSIIQSLNSQILIMGQLERVYKRNDQLQIFKDELQKDKQRLVEDQKKLTQINLQLETRCQQLIKFVKQQQEKIKEYQDNQQKLVMQRSQISKNLQKYRQIQQDNKQKTQANNCVSIQTSQKKTEQLDESIKQINMKFSKLKQASLYIRNKLFDQNLKIKKRHEKSNSLDNEDFIFSSIPAYLIRQKKFSVVKKNFFLQPQCPQQSKFNLKRCQSITQDQNNNNQIKVIDISESKAPSHNLKEQFQDLKMKINKPTSIYTINNEDQDDMNRSKYQFSTRLQSVIKQSSQFGVIKSQTALSDISDIQKTVCKTKDDEYLSHVHSVITNLNHQKQCMCQKVSNKFKKAHNLMFNFIVRDRIQPRRTFRRNKARQLQAKKII